MDHKKFKELMNLAVMNELDSAQKAELEEHLKTCSECSAEFKEMKGIMSALQKNTGKPRNVNDKLLEQARTQLHYALKEEVQKRKFEPAFFTDLKNRLNDFFMFNYKIAFGSIAVLVIGFLLGDLVFHQEKETPIFSELQKDNTAPVLQENTKIQNVRFIDQDASDGEVEFMFDAVKPVRMKGKISDEKIQNILTYSILNEENPGVRLNTINLINANQPQQIDKEIKDALLNAVQYDKNPGVRREALKTLKNLPYDEDIKNAMLYVLLNDKTSGLRIEAINVLAQAQKNGYNFNEQDLSVFKKKLEADENNYIRYKAKTVLEEKY
ncbi:MAG TPA: HEAT repeat domain-containing protein [Ignavibacteriaceae bacterium]|nr:HEAT repeat domain-containing protein [Ignavibacteriaceae bacterium]